jgi:sulfite reductase (NADPH) flavoprotein alpha-component
MSAPSRTPFVAPLLPENAPFSGEQRAWLNGFLAAVLSPGATPAQALTAADSQALFSLPDVSAAPADPLNDGDDGEAPWHDPSLPIDERMKLADGRPLRRRVMAAMAQQDCGQCGYTCENYSNAIFTGTEKKLNLCVPGGKETARMVKKLAEELASARADAPAALAVAKPADPGTPKGFSRDNPAPAVFMSRRRLNAEASEKETHHIEFDLTRSGLTYTPGDAFGIYANNGTPLVRAISRHLGVPLDEPISAEGMTRSLGDWLTHGKSLAPAPDALFALLAEISPDPAEKAKLGKMADGEGADGFDVLAALQAFRHLAPAPYRLLEALDPLQPRLYSISSSPRAMPGKVSLTVDVVRYQVEDRVRFGVASTFLAERVQEGDPVRVYVQPAHGFALPKSGDVPIIMVGPGTGVAPFRAFLQERLIDKAKGGAWLFYGHQREACDFFYREEFEEFLAKGALTHLTTAWSRDRTPKTYVQDGMRQNGAQLWDWLQRGAHFYVCGDAQRMAKDVETALADIVAEHGGRSADEADSFVAELKKTDRYQADVY